MKTKDLTTMAILTALALALSWMERMIPLELLIPLPGVKLGLANTVTLFALSLQREFDCSGVFPGGRCFVHGSDGTGTQKQLFERIWRECAGSGGT